MFTLHDVSLENLPTGTVATERPTDPQEPENRNEWCIVFLYKVCFFPPAQNKTAIFLETKRITGSFHLEIKVLALFLTK